MLDLDLDPFESVDLDPDLDQNGTREPFCDLDPFETEPGSIFGSGSV